MNQNQNQNRHESNGQNSDRSHLEYVIYKNPKTGQQGLLYQDGTLVPIEAEHLGKIGQPMEPGRDPTKGVTSQLQGLVEDRNYHFEMNREGNRDSWSEHVCLDAQFDPETMVRQKQLDDTKGAVVCFALLSAIVVIGILIAVIGAVN